MRPNTHMQTLTRAHLRCVFCMPCHAMPFRAMSAIQTVVVKTSVVKVVDESWNSKAKPPSSSGGDHLTTVYVAVGVVAAVVALGGLGWVCWRQRSKDSKVSENERLEKKHQTQAATTAKTYRGTKTGGAGKPAAAAAAGNQSVRPPVTKHAEVESQLAGFSAQAKTHRKGK